MDEKKLIEQKIFNDTSSYNDIMDVPYHQSKRHLPMNQLDRAFQFAPFGALQGFNDLIQQKTDAYEHKKYPNGEQETIINQQIEFLKTHRDMLVDVTYFNDESGFYEHVKGTLQKIEPTKGRVTFDDISVVVVNIRAIKRVRQD